MPLIKRQKRVKPIPITSEVPPPLELTDAPNELVPEENYSTTNIIEGDSTEDTRTLPTVKGKTLTFPELMDYLGNLTSEHWKHAMVYVYRLFPIIDTRLTDPNARTNIDVLTGPITSEEFVKKHGGGKYKILVNDIDYGRDKKGRSVCYSVFDISWTKFEPIINYEQLDRNHSANKAYINYLVNKGILDGRDFAVIDQNKGNTNTGEMIGFMRDLLDRMDRSNRQVLETIRQSANTGDSTAMNLVSLLNEQRDKREELMIRMMEGKGGTEQFTQMLALLKELRPAETGMNGQLQMFQQMLSMQEENRKTERELLLKLVEGKNQEPSKEPKSFKEQLEEAKEVAEMFGGNSGKKSTAEVVIDTVKEIIGGIAPIALQYIMSKQAGNGMIPNAPPINTTPTQVANPNPPAQLQEPNMKELAKNFIAQYGNLLIMQIDQEKSGAELADLVIEMFGMDGYIQVKSFGKENIIEAAKGNPAFWQRLTLSAGSEDEVITFINEFFDPPKEEETEGNEGLVQ